jgi:phosphatidylglycerophosphate synthase
MQMDGSLPGFPLWSMPQMRQTAKRTGIGGRGAIMELNGIPSISARAPMNLPNSITMSRIAMIPLLLWILSPHYPWQGPNGEQELAAAVLFVLASITDGVDGYLARKRSQITTMGMLLDPIADKVMVTAALIALVA